MPETSNTHDQTIKQEDGTYVPQFILQSSNFLLMTLDQNVNQNEKEERLTCWPPLCQATRTISESKFINFIILMRTQLQWCEETQLVKCA